MIDQAAIVICSAASIYFLSTKRHKVGFAFGLAGQPFWFYSAFTAGQWGVLALSFWFTFCHLRGIYNHAKGSITEIDTLREELHRVKRERDEALGRIGNALA